MKLALTDIDRPWFTSPADDEIVLEALTYGQYQVIWNKVVVGSVHLFNGKWHAYNTDGVILAADKYMTDPALSALLVCDRYATEVRV